MENDTQAGSAIDTRAVERAIRSATEALHKRLHGQIVDLKRQVDTLAPAEATPIRITDSTFPTSHAGEVLLTRSDGIIYTDDGNGRSGISPS